MNNVLDNMNMCYGCGSCANKCPKDAIEMKPNDNGFLYPIIDNDKCVDCKLCQKACPAYEAEYQNVNEPVAYAFVAGEEILKKSSSGGGFTVVAEEIFKNEGYVVGVSYDNNFQVHHEVISSMNEIDKFRRSKYVQSDTRKTYKETEDLLNAGKPVLYTGCPCQIAGLKKYLGKDYDNLTTIDLICHGVPSQKYFDEHLKNKFDVKNINDVSFRVGDGWATRLDITMNDGEVLKNNNNTDEYMKGFIKGIIQRKSCYSCQFCRLPRQGDITMGDLWSAAKLNLAIPYEKGISVILINNEKGQKLWNMAVMNTTTPVRMKKLSSLKGLNDNIFKSNIANTSNKFEEYYENRNFEEAVNMTLYKNDVGLVLHLSENYGSIFTNYALYKTVEDLGNTAIILDTLRPIGKASLPFVKKYMKVSSDFLSKDDWKSCNDICDTFIVGSDMTWNWGYASSKTTLEYMMLGFTDDSKRRIAYAPSFGDEKKTMEESHRILRKQYLKRFHAISVREDYGVSMCKNLFDVEAVQVLDPVFICDKKHYYDLLKDATIDIGEPYILAYILDPTPYKRKVLLETAKRLGKKLVVVLDLPNWEFERKKLSMNLDEYIARPDAVNWIAYFANADCVITDSFHGCCFSVMFGKKFVGIKNRSKHRFDSLANLLNVYSIFYEDAKVLYDKMMADEECFEELNYDYIYERLDAKRVECVKWLKDAMKIEVTGEHYDSHELLMEYAKLLRSRNDYKGITGKYKADEILDTTVKNELKTSSTFLEAICKANGILYEKNSIEDITDIKEYFEVLRQNNKYTVVVTCNDSCSRYWSDIVGKTGIVLKKSPTFRKSMILVLNGQKVVYEKIGSGMITHDFTNDDEDAQDYYLPVYIKAVSMDYSEDMNTGLAKLVVNNINYSMNRRGLNFIVIDNMRGRVIDSFNVDSHADPALKIVRK